MRSVTLFVLLASTTLAACAAPNAATRVNDTAVRAEPRRISSAGSFPDPLRQATDPISHPERY